MQAGTCRSTRLMGNRACEAKLVPRLLTTAIHAHSDSAGPSGTVRMFLTVWPPQCSPSLVPAFVRTCGFTLSVAHITPSSATEKKGRGACLSSCFARARSTLASVGTLSQRVPGKAACSASVRLFVEKPHTPPANRGTLDNNNKTCEPPPRRRVPGIVNVAQLNPEQGFKFRTAQPLTGAGVGKDTVVCANET